MKNKLLILTLFLPLWIGCFYDTPGDLIEKDTGSTYLSLRSSQIILPSDSVGELESITIESLRILVFSKETGKLVTNKLFSVGDLNLATYDSTTGNWRIDFSNMVVETKPGLSIIYVVLNESIMSISGQTLTGALNRLSTLTEMQNLVNTPLSYTTPLRVTYGTDGKPLEPPFIMSTFGEFDIPEGMDKDNPYTADLTGINQGFKLDRTMAKVTIDSLSSYPIFGGPETNNKETSSIFILEMGLVKVPMQYFWSPNRTQTGPSTYDPSYAVPRPPYTGAYQHFNFPLPNPELGYYERDWNGNIQFNFTATGYKTQTKEARVWWSGEASGTNAYTLNKYDLDAYIANKGYSTSADYHDDYNGGIPQLMELNQGNWPTWALNKLNDTTLAFGPTQYVFEDPDFSPVLTGGYWTLKEKNISYYLPEHILANIADTTNSTKLRVKAVNVPLPTTISPEESSNIVWHTQNWGPWKYAVVAGEPVTKALLNTLWGFERDTIVVAGIRRPIIRHYWNLGLRVAEGTNSGTLKNVQFKNITSSPDTKVFYLPIRNTPASPVDYNIYRNHEY
ncbi:MAG TPA: hypothetical protein DEB36_05450, partial [Porphyromonadaceae bacterium]|nr:hypothetical protein [Porphyromonadaceae bacterium]